MGNLPHAMVDPNGELAIGPWIAQGLINLGVQFAWNTAANAGQAGVNSLNGNGSFAQNFSSMPLTTGATMSTAGTWGMNPSNGYGGFTQSAGGSSIFAGFDYSGSSGYNYEFYDRSYVGDDGPVILPSGIRVTQNGQDAYGFNDQANGGDVPLMTAGMMGAKEFKEAANLGAFLIGSSTLVNEYYTLGQVAEAVKNDPRVALNKAFPGKFKGYSTNTINAIKNHKVAHAVAKGLGKPLLGVGIALTAYDIYDKDFSASSIAWGVADTGVAIAAIAISGPAAPFVAIGAGLYFAGRFAYGVYEAYNE